MKPEVIAGIALLVCCLSSSSAGGAYFMMNSSPEPETTSKKKKVPGCTDSTATNYSPEATEDDGSCIATVMGCTSPEAFNFSSEANTDDGSCVDYVNGVFTRPGGTTKNPSEITESKTTLVIDFNPSDKCRNKSGKELADCAAQELKICKDTCDTKTWCKGVKTSLNKEVKNSGHPLYCDFATTDVTRNKNPNINNDAAIGYLKA